MQLYQSEQWSPTRASPDTCADGATHAVLATRGALVLAFTWVGSRVTVGRGSSRHGSRSELRCSYNTQQHQRRRRGRRRCLLSSSYELMPCHMHPSLSSAWPVSLRANPSRLRMMAAISSC